MNTFPSILILDGAHQFKSLDNRLVHQSRFIAYQHPIKRHLFGLLKSRIWPKRALRRHTHDGAHMTLKTLNRYIAANLS